MGQDTLSDIISEQTKRALWEVGNVIACVPEADWSREYCGMPVWKHIYHMLHSLDLWLNNPRDAHFEEPSIHEKDLNNLDVVSQKRLTRDEIDAYFTQIKEKTERYTGSLRDSELLARPDGCEYTRFTLLLAQYRHLHTHMGMLMGFIISSTGKWPRVVGLEGEIPANQYGIYF